MTTIEQLTLISQSPVSYNSEIRELAKCAADELESLQRDRDEWKKHAEQSDKELCQLQDALGCPPESRNCHCDCGWRGYNQNDCPKCKNKTHDGGMADAQELAMNRLRDLIAEEGEAGDLRTQNRELRSVLEKMLENYIELKHISLLMAKSYAPNWIGKNMTPEDDIHVIAARKALGQKP